MRHITSTRWTRVPVLLPLTLAVGLGALACDDKNPVGPQSLSPPQPAVLSIEISGRTTLQRVGDTVQLSARATLADGTTREISSVATWSADHAEIVSVAGGRITARGWGQCNVSVFYGSASARVPVRVVPDGMFMLTGRVTTDNGFPLWPARVSIGSSPEFSASTNREGMYALPGNGDVEVRAEMDGFDPQVKRLTMAGDATLDFQLRFRGGGFGGMYTLTFTASASCTLPAEVMRRTYLARVVEAANGSVSVVVSGAEMVAWGESGFEGRRDGTRVQFALTDNYFANYVFVELVDPGRELAYSGNAAGDVGDTFVTTFNGTVTLRQRSGVGIMECRAEDHRLTFTR